MIDEKWETIMQEELDGVATATDRARLYERLALDPEVRASYEAMQRLSSAIRQIPVEEPPTSLKTSIMQAVLNLAPVAPARRVDRPSWWSELQKVFIARPLWGGGFVFASGIAVGLLVFALIGHTPTLNTQDLTGAMTPAERFERLGRKSIDFNGVHGNIETGISAQGPCLYLDLESGQPAEITVGFAGQPRAFRGFHQENPANGLVSFDAGGLRILHQGKNRYLLTEAPPAQQSDVLVRIRVGESILEERLPLVR